MFHVLKLPLLRLHGDSEPLHTFPRPPPSAGLRLLTPGIDFTLHVLLTEDVFNLLQTDVSETLLFTRSSTGKKPLPVRESSAADWPLSVSPVVL